MKEQPLDIASLMQIEDLKNANKVLDSMVNDLRAEVERLQAMQAARDAREQMQNDCIRLYVVRGADGRNYYGQTLQEAAKLATERKCQFREPDLRAEVPWQGQDGWEGKQ